jgi:DNA polymerase II small subunit
MKDDIEKLYAKKIRLTADAYQLVLNSTFSSDVLNELLSSNSIFLDASFVNSILEKYNSNTKQSSIQNSNESVQSIPASENSSNQKTQLDQNSETKSSNPTQSISDPDCLQDANKLKQSSVPAPNVQVIRSSKFSAIAKEYSPKIVIHNHQDVSGQSRCVGSVEDFVAYFRDRYKQQSAILKQRNCDMPILKCDQLQKSPSSKARLIAMVSDKRITSKGNLWLEVEDESANAKVLISSKEPIFKQAQNILLDDVIAFDGRVSENFFIANQISWPDIPVIRNEPKCESDLAIAYLSDLHLGSRFYLEKPFKRFLKWLKGEDSKEELASKVKYICIAGDIVDGIGVYPSQEKELTIKDIYAQYEEFDKIMEQIPDYIEVIVGPGNHDAVRRSDPQPFIPMDLIKSDVKKIGSPSCVQIESFNHLIYHGTSLDSIISNMSGLSYAKPEGPMIEMLKRRHLSPIYGENLIVPELHDFLVVSQEPDVLHMGHIHKNAYARYRGTLVVNSGTFQDRTDFQIKMGHIPSPCVVPILELKSQQLSHIKFLEEKL